jgi:hypothetical protein
MEGGRRRQLPAVGLVLLGLLAAACTGHPASTSSWQSSTDRTLGSVISGLGTARVAVVGESEDRLFHSYAVVTVTDAIDTSTKEVSSYLVSQPPDDLHRAHAAVTRALQDGITLLVDVRVALASPGLTSDRAARLVDQIDAMHKRLDALDKTVTSSPGSVGAS